MASDALWLESRAIAKRGMVRNKRFDVVVEFSRRHGL